jgi:hypothetical protein
VYCVIVFIAVIFAKSDSPVYNCNDTVVNWFIKEQFCNLHVWFMFIRVINPPLKKYIKSVCSIENEFGRRRESRLQENASR